VEAQEVESFVLRGEPRIDGLYISDDGRVFGAGTYTGSEVYRIHSDGTYETVASGLAGPTDLGMDADGNLYVSNFNGSTVSRIGPDGRVEVHARVSPGPAGIVVDPDGTIFVAQYGTGRGSGRSITRIAVDGAVSEFARSDDMVAPLGLARGPDGALYAANFYDGRIFRIDHDGHIALFATVTLPGGRGSSIGHLSSGGGGLIATAGPANRLYFIGPDGRVEPLGGDGSATALDGSMDVATFHHPNGIAEAPNGDVLIATAGNGPGDRSRLRRLVFGEARASAPPRSTSGAR